MSSADLFEDGFPHGTVEGFLKGCRGSACPAGVEHGLSCKRAKQLDAGDYRYKRLAREGKTPAEIAHAIDHPDTPLEHARHTVAAHLSAAQPLAERAHDPEPQEDAGAPAIETETAAEVTPSVEDEAMGHPTTPEETPAMPTPNDVAKPKPAPTPTTAPAPLTTDKWTEGLTRYAKTKVLTEIREWCRTNGYPGTPTHGRIPQDALAAYDAAHGEISIDIVADTTRLHEALAEESAAVTTFDDVVATAASIEAHDPRVSEVDLDAVEAEVTTDAIADMFDVPRELLGAAAGSYENAAKQAADRAREWSERMADMEDTVDELVTTPPKPLEPAEFVEAMDQARDRISVGAGPIVDMPTGERPDWGEVAISEDVERARDLAVRLEAENHQLQVALNTTIERWWAEVEKNNVLKREVQMLLAAQESMWDQLHTFARMRLRTAAERRRMLRR